MKYNGLIRVVSEQRRYSRVPFTSKIHYAYGPGFRGTAACTNIGLGGIRIQLGRYLRPGTLLMLDLVEGDNTEPVELKARVAWCRSAGGHDFVAGLQVFHDEPATAWLLERMTERAAQEAGHDEPLWSTPVPKVVMGFGF